MKALIRAENLTIEFPVYNPSHRSIRRAVVTAATGGRMGHHKKNLVSVRSIDCANFVISPGDRVGLVGHNGAGKTSMLRALSGVYYPTSGNLTVQGRVASLLDIALGMESESDGYDNIVLRGLILGMTLSEIEAKMEYISEFSELGEYLSLPLRTYSSGMLLRLAFAVSTCLESDIILMDEWLSVGDASFNEKASAKLKDVINNSSILVLASHSHGLIKETCNRVFRAEHGKFEEIAISDLKG